MFPALSCRFILNVPSNVSCVELTTRGVGFGERRSITKAPRAAAAIATPTASQTGIRIDPLTTALACTSVACADNEPVAAPRYGLDEDGQVRRIAQRLPQPLDGRVQAGVEINECIGRPKGRLQ